MKHSVYYFSFFLLLFMLSSCSDDDKDSSTSNQFEYFETEYHTPNVYLYFESNSVLDPQTGLESEVFDNEITIVLTDGIFSPENCIWGFSIDTKQYMYLSVVLDDIEVGNLSDVDISSRSYTLSNETETVTEISEITVFCTDNGKDYGEVDSGFFLPFSTTDTGTLSIQSVDIDYEAKTGTMECSYTINSAAVESITGSFKGRFAIVVD